MEKVYRLLRNNIEKGPFSIDELLQHHLQSHDLIWVEGISREWTLASDLDELNHSVLKGKQASPARTNALVFIQHPHSYTRPSPDRNSQNFTNSENFERRAEDLKRDINMFTPSYNHPPVYRYSGGGEKGNIKPFDDIDFVYHKSKKIKYSSHFVLTSLVFFLFLFGWYRGSILNRVAQHQDIPAKPLVVPASLQFPDKINSISDSVAFTPAVEVLDDEAPVKEVKKPKPVVKKRSSIAGKKKAAMEEPGQIIPEPSISTIEPGEAEEPIPTPVQVSEQPPPTVERKKTLGQSIKGLFKKRNKKTDTTTAGGE